LVPLLSDFHGWSGTDPAKGDQQRKHLCRDVDLLGAKNDDIEQKNGFSLD
jgi:hypothetical protein